MEINVILPDSGIHAVVTSVENGLAVLLYEDGREGAWPVTSFNELREYWPADFTSLFKEKEKYIRQAEIIAALADLDASAIRPLRATVAGRATAEDTIRLAEIETQAAALREELRALMK